ncbi:MAG: alpha/beta hydrolase [Candidatus Margulisbacteria bacterium]|nr:alpha/beta hydrolase [Candidatus Margulisiibacteriota bacterium]MBU1021289.1 alpha/beta hydrolase [Candidatus Margulisiibacteriota bacterium]MBU1729222.1 alpha/beta hydrolase [Candidatus Margulisiibacteriota bacterium]MBU1954895.1 alpha/beta hydrolase [Candidatus Margulisiibacteriota bacterium]
MNETVVLIHGSGDSAEIWGKTKTLLEKCYNCYAISFSNPYGSPEDQALELEKFLKDKKQPINLVAFSLGGLSARKYITNHPTDNRIKKLILLSAPNLGIPALYLNFVPAALIIISILGLIIERSLLFLPFLLIGVGIELLCYLRKAVLLSPSAFAMRPDSNFIKELNRQHLPEQMEYISILDNTKEFWHRLANYLFLYFEGDGVIPLSSQKLSQRCVPNFSKIQYKELLIDLPHFEIPYQAGETILDALTQP